MGAELYLQLLAGHLALRQLAQAKFLWQRIPNTLKEETPELGRQGGQHSQPEFGLLKNSRILSCCFFSGGGIRRFFVDSPGSFLTLAKTTAEIPILADRVA